MKCRWTAKLYRYRAVFGYLHRGIEKLAEERTFTGIIPLTDRLDYICPMSNNLA
jgi:NADH:ubiquinone oxidoreductase subunit D